MKAILAIAIFTVVLFSGCTEADLENFDLEDLDLESLDIEALKNAQFETKYSCAVEQFREREGPCSEIQGARIESCKIYDSDYIPSQGIPDYCIDTCLESTGFLDTYPAECIKIRIGENAPFESDELYLGYAEEAGTAYIEEENGEFYAVTEDGEVIENDEGVCEATQNFTCPSNCLESNDFDCCINSGQCWIDGACGTCNAGTCQFDSDCSEVCQGNILWKQGCNLLTASCERTTNIDCSTQSETFEGETFQSECNAVKEECTISKLALQTKRDELRDKHSELTGNMQKATELYQDFSEQCISTAEQITNKLIIDSAIKLGSLPTTVVKGLSNFTVDSINYGIDKIGGAETSAMTSAEFLVWSCQMRDRLLPDIDRLNDERSEVFAQIERYDAKINSLE